MAEFYKRDKRNFEKLKMVSKWYECRVNKLNKDVFQTAHLTNLYGKELIATSFEYKPYTYPIDNKIDGTTIYGGVEVCIKLKKLTLH